MADDTADDSTADCSCCAPSGQNSTTNGTSASTNGRILALTGHAGASSQGKRHRDG